jgi:hypothetical protein
MQIEIPAEGGIVPGSKISYDPKARETSYKATITVVGVYTSNYGYGAGSVQLRAENEVYVGETRHETEQDAVEEAVNKLADMLTRLL